MFEKLLTAGIAHVASFWSLQLERPAEQGKALRSILSGVPHCEPEFGRWLGKAWRPSQKLSHRPCNRLREVGHK